MISLDSLPKFIEASNSGMLLVDTANWLPDDMPTVYVKLSDVRAILEKEKSE